MNEPIMTPCKPADKAPNDLKGGPGTYNGEPGLPPRQGGLVPEQTYVDYPTKGMSIESPAEPLKK